jgi:hypothetical protein
LWLCKIVVTKLGQFGKTSYLYYVIKMIRYV